MNIKKITKYASLVLLLIFLIFLIGYYFPPREILQHNLLDAYRYGFKIIVIELGDVTLTYAPLPLIEGAVLFFISSFAGVLTFLTWLIAHTRSRHNPKTVNTASPQSIPKTMNPLQTAFYYKGKITSKDCLALVFHWAQKGYVAIQGLPENLSQQGKLVKLSSLPANAPSSENILFNALFAKEPSLAWSTIGFIIENHFGEIEQTVFKENYFDLYNGRAKQNSFIAFILCFIPLVLLQIFRKNSLLLVSIPSLSLFCAAAYFIHLAITRKIYSKERKLGLFALAVVCGVGALCVHIVLPFEPATFNQWFDYYAYIASLLALPFAAALDRPPILAIQKLHEIKQFRNYLSARYPLNLAIQEQADYIYTAMPYAIALSAEDLLNERITQNELVTPSWYEPIWYEDKEGKGKPATLTKMDVWNYYNYAVKDASHTKKGVLGKTQVDPGSSPFGPFGPTGPSGYNPFGISGGGGGNAGE